MANALTHLETKISFQERTIETLNAVVTDQEVRIEALERQVRLLQQYLQALPVTMEEAEDSFSAVWQQLQ